MLPSDESIARLYREHGEKVRFLVVGAWNTAFSYALFAVLLWAFGPLLVPLAASPSSLLAAVGANWYLIVQWAGWVLAVPQSTLTMKHFVFHSRGHALSEIGRGYLVYLPLQGMSMLMLWLFVDVAGLHPLAGQLATVTIASVLAYFGHKHLTFRQPAAR